MTWKKRCMQAVVFSLTLGLWAQAHAVAPVLGCAANNLTPQNEQFYAAEAEDSNGGGETWQIIIGDPIIIGIGSKGTKALWACQPDGIHYQYYDTASWGSNIWLNGASSASQYTTPYYIDWGYFDVDPPVVTADTNTKTVDGDTTTVTTQMTLGSAATLKQIITYKAGSYGYNMRWELKNVSGATLSDVRFIHGGDTYFGYDDSARTWYHEDRKMIYINNDVFSTSGIMAFQGSDLTPADHYFAGDYYDGGEYASLDALLPDFADPIYQDAGYQLQWNRASLANNATFVIEASEQLTNPTPIAVIAPANQSSVNNRTVSLNFLVHNLDEGNQRGVAPLANVPHTLNLTAESAKGWDVSIVGGSQITLDSLERQTVQVNVTVPGNATITDEDAVTLTATDATDGSIFGSGSTKVAIYASSYTISADSMNFNGRAGGSSRRTITIRNTPPVTREGVAPLAAAASTMVIGQVGGSDPLEAPFSFGTDTCSNQEIPSGAECTIEVVFAPEAPGEYSDSYNIPVLSPVPQNWTIAVSGSASEAGPSKLYDEKINYGCFIDTLLR